MRSVHGGTGDLAYIEHDGVIHETDDALLYSIGGEKVWIPKSWIKDKNDEIIAIPKKLADEKGLESDW